ncbi:MAG: S1C family serine protease [Nitrosopumilus sp.]
MKTREKIEISVISVLVIVIANIVLFDNFSSNTNSETVDTLDNDIYLTPVNAESLDISNDVPNLATLSEYDKQLSKIYEDVSSSVVLITSEVTTTNNRIIINGNPLEQHSSRLGSGFVYDELGHIVTNNHVVENVDTVNVSFTNGDTFTAKVIGVDPDSDLAVLSILDDVSDDLLVPIPIGDSDLLKVGQTAIAIGNPFGLSNTMTSGIISQIGRILPNQNLGFSIPNVIQTDAAINPGNSGGPLLNIRGEVIGINSAIQSQIGEFVGVGFAIPSNTMKKIIPILIKDGSYDHPWLGISGTTLTKELSKNLNLPENYKGVIVNQVIKESPAEDAGLKEALYSASGLVKNADIIIAVDDYDVQQMDDLIIYLSENKNVHDSLQITVNRDGKILTLDAVLAERPPR